ncbi:MAG: SH3 domain-containing protein [bacterium]|nr:SH3 domain-containing protein [bacterium]
MKNVRWYTIWMTWCVILSLLSGIAEAQLKHLDPAVRVISEIGVNARSEPRTRPNTLIKRVVLGTLMKRIGKRGVWYHVILPGGEEAWVHGDYVKEETARDLLEVKGRGVRVRKSPSTAASIVVQLSRGQMLSLIRERNSWYQVLLPSGNRGWVHKNLVIRRPLSPPEKEGQRAKTVPEPKEPPKPEPQAPPVDYYRKGQALVAEKRVDEAVEAFQKALEQKPNDGAIHYDLARLLHQKEDLDAALVHFRKALSAGNRSEAQFYIDEILKIQAGAMAQAEGEAIEDPLEEAVLEGAGIDMAYLLPGLAAGSVVFLVVLGLIFYRRRQASRMDRPVFQRRNKDDGFDTVLKYAVEKRPLLRAIEEAERKRAEMDEALQQQFVAFGQRGDGRPRLPTGESPEALLKKVEDLRQTILNQEERAQIYADLVLLQNEKLDAMDEEIVALKKLIQVGYQETSKKSGKHP